MTVQQAIETIQTEYKMYTNLWEKHGRQRIYIEFNFKGSTRKAGFIGSDKTELQAQPCGKHTSFFQEKLDEIAKLEIEWSAAEPAKIATRSYIAAKASQERMERGAEWMFTHNL